MSTEPEFRTRKPSGKPPWPLVLLAGVEKSGKSYSSAQFSACNLIDRTFYIEIGEGAADQYGEIPGARYEIVEHDGTYVGIGRAVRAATMQPRPNGTPHAIVIDSMTELWDLLSDEAQQTANRRKNKGPDAEVQITMDLWNTAKKRWRHILDLLRTYDGPVIFTARLEQVAVVENGKPTEAREWKVRAEKNLPFECDVVVKMVAQDDVLLTGVRSLRLQTGPRGRKLPGFSLEKLFEQLGISAETVAPRSYTAPTVAPEAAPQPPSVREPQPSRGRVQRGPQDDSAWEQPEPERPSMQGQHMAIAQLFTTRYGITARDRKLAGVAHHVGRTVGSTTELSYAEASQLIETLSKLPPHRPAPKPSEEQQQATARAQAEALAATDEPDADRIEAAHRDAIESAGSSAEVAAVQRRVNADVAKKLIGTVARDLLMQAAQRKKDAFAADAPWTSGVSQQMDAQGVAA